MLCLTRLKLTAFGRFRDAEFQLKPGFNLISGANEAGKSTFAAAIAGVIFGLKKERLRYVPWDGGGRCEAEVAFTYGAREMTIARDFLNDRVRAVERQGDEVVWRFEGKVSPAGRSSEREEYLEKIEEVWGFSEGDIFRNSVFVGQRDLPIEGDGHLSGRLQQLLSGFGEMDYDAVVADLEKELYAITRKPGGRSRERELEEVRSRLAEIDVERRNASESLAELQRQEAVLGDLAAWLDKARRDLEKGQLYLDRVRRFRELTSRKKELETEFARIDAERRKVEKLHAAREESSVRLAALADAAVLPDDFPMLLRAHEEIVERLASVQAAAFAEEQRIAEKGGGGGKGLAAMLVVVWLLAAGALYAVPKLMILTAGAAVLVSLIVLLPMLKNAQTRRLAMSRRAGRLDALMTERAGLTKSIAAIEEVLAGYGVVVSGESHEVIRGFETVKQLHAESARIESALSVLPELSVLETQAGMLARELAVVGERLERVAGKGFPLLNPEEMAAAEGKMRRLEGEVQEKERLFRDHGQEVAIIRRTSLDAGRLEDEEDELRSREARLAGRVAALQLAAELMREAVDEYRATYLDRLARDIESKLARLTSGRYREVRLDADFMLSLAVCGDARPVAGMSCGAQDQAYLATRLALGGILSHGKKLPFLLDDPLVNFDEQRRNVALQTLCMTARDHQMLLFVHDERYAQGKVAAGWNRITLRDRGDEDGQLYLL
jgi:energy-coupling factor transporter ATP-binding protein EcfA2